MEFIFIRHGHGEHLNDYPNKLNTFHPGLTEYGKFQVNELAGRLTFDANDLILVSPTKRTIETALLLNTGQPFIITPLVGPRMFPQNPSLPELTCDQIYTKNEILELYRDMQVVDFDLNCWDEGINAIEHDLFESYGRQLFDWIGDRYRRVFVISHDGTITNYRMLLGETGLTRDDFLGEAGVYKLSI